MYKQEKRQNCAITVQNCELQVLYLYTAGARRSASKGTRSDTSTATGGSLEKNPGLI